MKKTVFLIFVLLFFAPLLTKGEGIKWQPYKEGLGKGKLENKKIFLNFYADW